MSYVYNTYICLDRNSCSSGASRILCWGWLWITECQKYHLCGAPPSVGAYRTHFVRWKYLLQSWNTPAVKKNSQSYYHASLIVNVACTLILIQIRVSSQLAGFLCILVSKLCRSSMTVLLYTTDQGHGYISRKTLNPSLQLDNSLFRPCV